MANEHPKDKGRRLLVEFTCGRCGRIDYMPYNGNPSLNDHHNMHTVDVPAGWTNASGYVPLLCDNCSRDYRAFMGIPEEG